MIWGIWTCEGQAIWRPGDLMFGRRIYHTDRGVYYEFGAVAERRIDLYLYSLVRNAGVDFGLAAGLIVVEFNSREECDIM